MREYLFRKENEEYRGGLKQSKDISQRTQKIITCNELKILANLVDGPKTSLTKPVLIIKIICGSFNFPIVVKPSRVEFNRFLIIYQHIISK